MLISGFMIGFNNDLSKIFCNLFMSEESKDRQDELIKSSESKKIEVILPENEDISYEALREIDFEHSIRISLEKLSGYDDSRLLGIYPEYAFNNGGEETGEPLIVKSVAELREGVVSMRDPVKTIAIVNQATGRVDSGVIMIVYDDLPPGSTVETARKRWADFYRDNRTHMHGPPGTTLSESLSKIGTEEYREAAIQEAKFEGLNTLRGLRGDRVIAIREVFNNSLHIYSVAESRRLIENMENIDNDLARGRDFRFRIEEYDKAEEFVAQERMELSLRDIRGREDMLKEISQYGDDTMLTWIHPNELVNLGTGKFMIMQDIAADLRRRIKSADHDELDWFSHAGGIEVVATGEVNMDDVAAKLQEGVRVFHKAVQGVINKVSSDANRRLQSGGLDDGNVIDAGKEPEKLS